MNKKIKNVIVYGIIIINLILFWMIFNSVLKNGSWIFDEPINSFIHSFVNPILTFICIVLARIGGRAGTAILTIVLSIISAVKFKNKKMAIVVILNIVFIGLLNHLIKEYVQRPRPDYRMMNVDGYSFPSGHSMISMAEWGLLISIAYKYIKNAKIKWLCICLMSILILAMGASRIYLGVHYPSDVISGFLLGLVYIVFYTKTVNVFLKNKEKCNNMEEVK